MSGRVSHAAVSLRKRSKEEVKPAVSEISSRTDPVANSGLPTLPKIPILRDQYDKWERRKISAGATPRAIARDFESLSQEQLSGLVRAGYVEQTDAYKELQDKKRQVDEHQTQDAERRKELQGEAAALEKRLYRAKRAADRKYLNNLIRSKRKEIGQLDSHAKKEQKEEDKLDSKIATEEKGIRAKVLDKLEDKVENELELRMRNPRRRERSHGDGIFAGKIVNLLEIAGIDGLVERTEPPPLPKAVRKGRSGGVTNVKAISKSPYFEAAVKAAKDNGILPEVFLGLIYQESKFNPNAKSGANCLGIAQFATGTAAHYGLNTSEWGGDKDQPTVWNPYKALPASAKYLKKLYNMFSDWGVAVGAYNCGEGGALNAASKYKEGRSYPDWYNRRLPPYAETQKHADAIMNGHVPAILRSGVLDGPDEAPKVARPKNKASRRGIRHSDDRESRSDDGDRESRSGRSSRKIRVRRSH